MLTIRRAAAADQPQLMAIYRTAQEYMLQAANPTQRPLLSVAGVEPLRYRSGSLAMKPGYMGCLRCWIPPSPPIPG